MIKRRMHVGCPACRHATPCSGTAPSPQPAQHEQTDRRPDRPCDRQTDSRLTPRPRPCPRAHRHRGAPCCCSHLCHAHLPPRPPHPAAPSPPRAPLRGPVAVVETPRRRWQAHTSWPAGRVSRVACSSKCSVDVHRQQRPRLSWQLALLAHIALRPVRVLRAHGAPRHA